MEHDQRIIGVLQDDQTLVGSVESIHGNPMPPMQSAREQVYMAVEEEIKRTVDAWWGAKMLAQFAVYVQDIEALVREAERALQETVAQILEDIALLTQETRTTFGRVENAIGDMDSRVESRGASL